MKEFGHSGDLGDIIYSLPAIRALGGGRLYLWDSPGMTSFPMTRQRANILRDFLLWQPYIHDVVFSPEPMLSVIQLNDFRRHVDDRPQLNIPQMHLRAVGKPLEFDIPWLIRPFRRSYPEYQVVIWRTSRFQSPNFPWRPILKRLKDARRLSVCFLGHLEEFAEFLQLAGPLDFPLTYVHTPTLREAFPIIGDSSFCIGNQTSLAAMAHGLGKPIFMERSGDNVRFDYPGSFSAVDDSDFPYPHLERILDEV